MRAQIGGTYLGVVQKVAPPAFERDPTGLQHISTVGDAQRFLKIPVGNVYVFHDEIDLAPGKVKVKAGGGNAGHNGLRSITAHIGNDYRRVRLGIGHPGDKALVHDYVLSDFAKAEMGWVETVCRSVCSARRGAERPAPRLAVPA